METKTINEWKHQVLDYLNKLDQDLQKNEHAKDLYFGFDVIDGQLRPNPDILFIGINPGSSDKKNKSGVRMETPRISYLDIYNTEVEDKYSYPLATNIVNMLKLAGMSEDEIIKLLDERSVKTNLFHIATVGENEIKQALNLSSISNYQKYFQFSTKYCVDLIKIINPKIVIFEGKSTYENIIEVCYGHKNTWNNDLDYGYFFDKLTGVYYIGFSRTYSNINQIESVASKLNEVFGQLEQTHI